MSFFKTVNFSFRELTKPVEGSLTFAPKEAPKAQSYEEYQPPPMTEIYCGGQVMARNDPTKPAGLGNQCLDDDVPSGTSFEKI